MDRPDTSTMSLLIIFGETEPKLQIFHNTKTMGVVRHGLLYRRPWPCGPVWGNALVHHTMSDSEYARFVIIRAGGGRTT